MPGVTSPSAPSASRPLSSGRVPPLPFVSDNVPFVSDNGPGTRATLGLVVLQTDEVIEGDLRAFLPGEGIAIHHTRIPFDPHVTPETLARMEADLAAAVALLPENAPFDAIGYGCTSASAVIGSAGVAARIRSVFPGVAVTDPLHAITAALSALSARKIVLVTPYIPQVSEVLRARLSEHGFETVTLASFEQVADAAVARITPDSIAAAAIATAKGADADAVVIACTNLRTSPIIAQIEEALGIPVISSNSAIAWHMARLAGLTDASPTLGRLGTLMPVS